LTIVEPFIDKIRTLSGWRRLLVAGAFGALGATAFPPFYFFPALLLSYVALIVLLDGCTENPRLLRGAALIGWSYGFGFFLLGLHWIGYPFLVNAEAHAWLMPFAIVLLPAGLALFFALSGAVCGRFWRPGPQRVFLFAASFALVEWLRGHILTGFPWNIPGYGWGASTALLQSTSIFGVYGLSLLTLLLGASLVLIISSERCRWLPLGMIGFFLLLWVNGTVRLIYASDETVPGVQLRIVQPATLQSEKYRPEFRTRNWERLTELTKSPAEITPTHIIWPEAAPPFPLAQQENALREIAVILGDERVLLTGAVRVTEDDDVTDFYNSFYILGEGGRILATYDKFHLVPFGEYLPFERTLNSWGITQIGGGLSGFSEGPGPQTFGVPGAPPAGPLICYEVIFPGAVTGETRPGWLVNITDDSWFGPNAGPSQHLLIARVRAIEEGLPIARAANAGVSVIADGYGRVRSQLELGARGVLDGPLPVALPATPFLRFGDTIFFLLILLCLSAAFLPLQGKRT
jgi:apolipoprotein N-acyltransferase